MRNLFCRVGLILTRYYAINDWKIWDDVTFENYVHFQRRLSLRLIIVVEYVYTSFHWKFYEKQLLFKTFFTSVTFSRDICENLKFEMLEVPAPLRKRGKYEVCGVGFSTCCSWGYSTCIPPKIPLFPRNLLANVSTAWTIGLPSPPREILKINVKCAPSNTERYLLVTKWMFISADVILLFFCKTNLTFLRGGD